MWPVLCNSFAKYLWALLLGRQPFASCPSAGHCFDVISSAVVSYALATAAWPDVAKPVSLEAVHTGEAADRLLELPRHMRSVPADATESDRAPRLYVDPALAPSRSSHCMFLGESVAARHGFLP